MVILILLVEGMMLVIPAVYSWSGETVEIPAETMRRKWRRLKCLLSTEYAKKHEKMSHFSLLVEGDIIMSASKTVFSGSNAKGENISWNGTSKVEQVKTFIVNGICKKIRKNGTVFLLVVGGHDVRKPGTVKVEIKIIKSCWNHEVWIPETFSLSFLMRRCAPGITSGL
jgi:hypothetical protein